MTGYHNNPATPMPPYKTGLFWLTITWISLALAGDTPPPTLPKGFLEDLPLIEKLKDDEFNALVQFAAEKWQAAKPDTATPKPSTGDVTDDK